MTPVMLPTSEWSAKWYHLHKWKFFHGQIELTCRFSKTLKGALHPRGLSTLEVEEACYLLRLVCCMAHRGPSQKWGGGVKEGQCNSPSPGILEQDKCTLFSSQKELAPSLALLWRIPPCHISESNWKIRAELEVQGCIITSLQGPYSTMVWDSWIRVEHI